MTAKLIFAAAITFILEIFLRPARSHVFVRLCYLACGEPPMCMSCCALFAVKKAIDAARTEIGNKDLFLLRK